MSGGRQHGARAAPLTRGHSPSLPPAGGQSSSSEGGPGGRGAAAARGGRDPRQPAGTGLIRRLRPCPLPAGRARLRRTPAPRGSHHSPQGRAGSRRRLWFSSRRAAPARGSASAVAGPVSIYRGWARRQRRAGCGAAGQGRRSGDEERRGTRRTALVRLRTGTQGWRQSRPGASLS